MGSSQEKWEQEFRLKWKLKLFVLACFFFSAVAASLFIDGTPSLALFFSLTSIWLIAAYCELK